MAIPQLAGGNGGGILGFLFQDDGSIEGSVLEGAEFAKTLHQLLGEEEATDAPGSAPLFPGLGSTADTEADSAALTAELDTLASDPGLPAHGAELPVEAGWDGDSDSHGGVQPFWGLVPFSDLMKSVQQESVAADDEALAAVSNTAADSSEGAPVPVFSKGIQYLIELARDAEQAAAQLTQASVTTPATQAAPGRNAPAGGKVLPQVFRSIPQLQNFAASASSARNAQVPAMADIPQAGASEPAFGTLLNAAFASDTANTNTQQSPAAAQALVQGLGLRAEAAPVPLAKAASESAAMPQFDSAHIAGSEAWFDDLATRVEWLRDMNVETAELQLHPAELGQLEIHIANGDEGTTVSFVTHNADARTLIEDNLPKLRELLAQQGLQLGDSQVSQQSGSERRAQDAETASAATAADANGDDAEPVRRTVYVRDPNRIDHYV